MLHLAAASVDGVAGFVELVAANSAADQPRETEREKYYGVVQSAGGCQPPFAH